MRRINDVDPKSVLSKENTEHGLDVRKIYQPKLQRIVSNISSRTSNTLVLLLLLLLPLLGYYYASNIVLEESMMQVSFGLTTHTPFQVFSFFFLLEKRGKKVKLLILLPLGIYVEWLSKFPFSSRASYSRRDLGRVEVEMIEYCVDWLFACILW